MSWSHLVVSHMLHLCTPDTSIHFHCSVNDCLLFDKAVCIKTGGQHLAALGYLFNCFCQVYVKRSLLSFFKLVTAGGAIVLKAACGFFPPVQHVN